MAKPRDTVTYDLKKGNTVVYRGTTKNPDRREQEHRSSGLDFDRLSVTSRRMSAEGAKQKEQQNLETYRRNHGGKNPKYNRDQDG